MKKIREFLKKYEVVYIPKHKSIDFTYKQYTNYERYHKLGVFTFSEGGEYIRLARIEENRLVILIDQCSNCMTEDEVIEALSS